MSEAKSYPTEEDPQDPTSEPEERLQTISEVMGWQVPEPLDTIDAEKEGERILNDTPYNRWKADPSADNLFEVTKSVQPTIDSVLASIGATGNPQMAAKARVLTAKAIKSYDPTAGASLNTWVSSQLRPLTRENRKSNNVLSIPEGAQLDAYALYRAEQELTDKLDREPTVQELADHSHLSIKRIEGIRKKMRPTVSDAAMQDGANTSIEGSATDYSQDAMDYVYADSDLMDRKVMEYVLGYGGHEQLDNAAIRQKLGLTDVQLTRRKQRIALRMQKIMDDLENV